MLILRVKGIVLGALISRARGSFLENYMQNIYMAMYRAIIEWNSLDVQTRNSVSKSSLGTVLKSQIVNPYMKVL